jgi:hypothetical protein
VQIDVKCDGGKAAKPQHTQREGGQSSFRRVIGRPFGCAVESGAFSEAAIRISATGDKADSDQPLLTKLDQEDDKCPSLGCSKLLRRAAR